MNRAYADARAYNDELMRRQQLKVEFARVDQAVRAYMDEQRVIAFFVDTWGLTLLGGVSPRIVLTLRRMDGRFYNRSFKMSPRPIQARIINYIRELFPQKEI